MKPKTKQLLTSLVIGLIWAYTIMIVHSYGSTIPNTFEFYWALFTGLFISFSVVWKVKKFQKKPEE